MDAKDLISVIVPVYNVEQYLSKCIDSIINQTYKNLEIILVNDGSTDRSGAICNAYKEKDIRINVIHKRNGGLSSARNRGLEIAKGEYIGFVDSDDYIALDMYESLIGYFGRDVDIVTCGRFLVFPHGKCGLKQKTFCAKQVTKYNKLQAIEELLKTEIFAYGVNEKLYRRELFNDIRFPLGKISEDLPVTYSLFKRCRNVINIGEAKYYNFQRNGSISRSEFSFRKMNNVFFRRDILLDVKSEYPQFEKLAEAGYVNSVLARLLEIKTCKNRLKYNALEERLIKILKRMRIRIFFNSYLDRKIIFDILK